MNRSSVKKLFITFSLSLGILTCMESSAEEIEKILPATQPIENTSHWVPERYKEVKHEMQELPCDLLFVGDSITEGWEREGKEIWNSEFLPLKAVNFGVSGDRTDNVLWRIRDTDLKTTTSPKFCIVLLGTNNIGKWGGRQKTGDIVQGIQTVCQTLLKKFPATHIILMGVTPYGNDPVSPLRKQGDAINDMLSKLDMPNIQYLSINDKLLNPDGTHKAGLFRDQVHLTGGGYRVWADTLLPLLRK